MAFSGAGLERYLYGLDGVPGELTVEGYLPVFTAIREHRVETKSIPSGFFSLPNAEHVSAIMFSNSGTLAKFSRMAIQEAPSKRWRVIRRGLCFDRDPESVTPALFQYEVGDGQFFERWEHGLQVFHNPNAVRPLSLLRAENVNEVFFDHGKRKEYVPIFSVIKSKTKWEQRRRET